jgi:hypothetical protein
MTGNGSDLLDGISGFRKQRNGGASQIVEVEMG